jgi:hypothetical protein
MRLKEKNPMGEEQQHIDLDIYLHSLESAFLKTSEYAAYCISTLGILNPASQPGHT